MSLNDQLPDGWTIVKFGDVAKQVKEKVDPETSGLERVIRGGDMDTDDLKLRRWALVGDGYLGPAFHRKFTKGQILYGSRRTYLRKVAVADFDGICANTTFVIEARPKKIHPPLLPFIMQSEPFTEHSIRNSKGSTNPYINWKDIAKYEFALPLLDEQRRIAEILWAVEDTARAYEKCLDELTTLQKVQFREWHSQNLSDDSWQSVSLGEVCDIQNGQVDPTVQPYRNMIHIAADDIETGTGRILERNTAAEDGITSGKYEFTPDAILYSKIRPNLKKVALPDFPGVCSADMYPVYPNHLVMREYLYHILLSKQFTDYAVAESVRSAIPKINRRQFNAYKFDLPPIKAQEDLVDLLRMLTNRYRQLEQHIIETKTLKKSLIATMLSSEFEYIHV